MAGYAPGDWATFAAAQLGAAAALTGLLFVAVSINLEKILSFPRLPARAAETLLVLVLVLGMATLVLVPQGPVPLGLEMALFGAAVATGTLRVQVRHGPDHQGDPWTWFASRVAWTQATSVCFLLGGVSLALGWGGGLYWLVPASLSAVAGSVYGAWVLLVEIIRQQPPPSP
jgi:hypothetical protein